MPRPVAVLTGLVVFVLGCSDPIAPDHQVTRIEVAPKSARIWLVGDSVKFITNITTAAGTGGAGLPVSWVSRDLSLLSVTADGLAKSLKKGASTYVVATAGGKSDSALVDVPLTPCGAVAPSPLQVGQVATDIGPNGFCAADNLGAEYTLIVFNSSLNSAGTVSIEVIGQGLGTLTTGGALMAQAAFVRSTDLGRKQQVKRDTRGEAAFREAQTKTLSPRVADAQAWYRRRPARAIRVVAAPLVGDLRTVNVSMGSGCSSSRVDRTARVAAVSASAIVLNDQANPTGGFTDAEYASFATTFDTLVNPLDTQTFGAPTDLDGNGRVIILFTRAINELTPVSSLSYTGGRTMSRDLFPTTGTGDATHPGGCASSNVAEIFYMLVPDPNGVVNGNAEFTSAFVKGQTSATIAHEYQHMINISRRMYLLGLSSDTWMDEVWLHEGLSHMAEELLFHRASGLATRTNIAIDQLRSAQNSIDTFNEDMVGDFLLYDSYVAETATKSPYLQIDDVATRGATWSLLRYAADRLGDMDGSLWYNLVNSGLIGVTNLQAQLGQTGSSFQGMVRDFTVSVYADDHVGVVARYTQPSWNMRSIYPGFGDPTFTWPLVTRSLSDNARLATSMVAGGFSVYRFQALPGTQALVRATGPSGGIMPGSVTLSVIRTK